MRLAANLRSALLASLERVCAEDNAAQILEFALSLPLLVVFVIGIFDFSGAISLKQKLMNAAREGARIAAADPANDLGGSASANGVPASVNDVNQAVDNYLISENINDCGLKTVIPAQTTGLTWASTAAGSGCPGAGLTLTVNRGCKSQVVSGSNTINLIQTCVTITYAYSWQFNRVMGLLGGNAAGPASLSATATAFNEN